MENEKSVTELRVGNASRTISYMYKFLKSKGPSQGVCPHHNKPCTFHYTEGGIEIQDCVSCQDSEFIPVDEEIDIKKKKTLRQIGIDKVAPYIYSDDIKKINKGMIIFIKNKLDQIFPVWLTGRKASNTYECIRLDSTTLKIKIQTILNSSAFSPADIQNIIDYYFNLEAAHLKQDVLYISEPSQEFTLTYKLIEDVTAVDNLNNAPTWKEFMTRISDPVAFSAFVWSVFETKHRGRQMLYVEGRSGEEGKSIMAKAIRSAIGLQYVASMSPGDFSTRSNFGLSQADGKRLLVIPDVNNDKLLKYDGLKQILGGDIVKVENKFEKAYTTVIDCRVIAFSNYPLDLTGENFETSRLLWLEIKPMSEFIVDLEKKLADEFSEYLKFCKYAYSMACKNDYHIESDDSAGRIADSLSIKIEDGLSNYANYFEEGKDFYITRTDFNEQLKIANKSISNKEINDIKLAYAAKGFDDFKSIKGHRMYINGQRVSVYRGLRSASGRY